MKLNANVGVAGDLVLDPFPAVIDDLVTVFDPVLGAYVRRDLGTDDTLTGTATGDTIKAYDGNDTVNAGDGNDMMFDLGKVREPVTGTFLAKTLNQAAITQTITDNDVFNGGAGNDTLLAGNGTNVFNGGAGSDTVSYAYSKRAAYVDLSIDYGRGDGTETLTDVESAIGSELADFLMGDDAGNQLWGRGGDDILIGRGGGDWLYGDAGNDWLDGGAGPDVLSGGAGIDTAQYATSALGVIVSLALGRGYSGDAAGDIIQGVENISGSAKNDVLTGNGLANKLMGNAGNDVLYGEAGNDTLSAGEGNDTVDGGAGNDSISGSGGNDILTGGLGRDSMWGGLGADIFRFNSAAEFDNLEVINDFKKGEDKIDISRIDANPAAAGNQAFVYDYSDSWAEEAADALNDLFGAYVGNGPTVNGDVGEVTYRHSGGDTWVFVQLHDGTTYAQFRIEGHVSLSASDFIL